MWRQIYLLASCVTYIHLCSLLSMLIYAIYDIYLSMYYYYLCFNKYLDTQSLKFGRNHLIDLFALFCDYKLPLLICIATNIETYVVQCCGVWHLGRVCHQWNCKEYTWIFSQYFHFSESGSFRNEFAQIYCRFQWRLRLVFWKNHHLGRAAFLQIRVAQYYRRPYYRLW